MRKISEHIELEFYKALKQKITLLDFEQWVYKTDELEHELPDDVYIDLISLNFKGKFAHDELAEIISSFVKYGEFEIKRLEKYLISIISRDSNCAESIEMTYDLYCDGYVFLRRLGLVYGLTVACPPMHNYQKSWKEISKEEQDELLNEFYPEIITDAKNALAWIHKRKIVIENTLDENGHYEYKDLRNQEEINQGEIQVVNLNQQDVEARANSDGEENAMKSWWKFWNK